MSRIVTVRQESNKNKTLSITLTKAVLEIVGSDKIKKGDKLAQWADADTGIIYLRKVEPNKKQ